MTPPSILFVSQNGSLPSRRRPWQQALALAERGWSVKIICPRHPGEKSHEILNDIVIERFGLPFEGRTRLGLICEYAFTFFSIARLMIKARMREHIDVIQTINPPDWVEILIAPLRFFGCRSVFDFTDLCTALYRAKFNRKGMIYHGIAVLQLNAMRQADLVIAANDAYRRLALVCGRRSRQSTLAVHSYPSTLPTLRQTRRTGPLRVGFFGVIGDQDGVDTLLKATAELAQGSCQFELIVVGDGPALPRMKRLSLELEIQQIVRFCGYLNGDACERAIGDFDVAVIPDPLNRYTRTISVNKLFVYAAHGLPIVATPLPGTQRQLGNAAIYSQDCRPSSLAEVIQCLLRDSRLRSHMGRLARKRATVQFDWEAEAEQYCAAVASLLPSGFNLISPDNS